uniref:Phosphatidylethanolamine N-methyltransferase n=1 Tax=Equus caballus TaxID=9796 RepID=A0A3Q2LSR9_HORSE
MSSSVAGPDCCGGLGNIDFRQADLYVMTRLLGYVDISDPRFVAAVLAITFNPLFWNVVARWEQKTRKLSRAFRSPYLACYSLGCAILLLNFLRSHCFTQAMLSQPKMESLDNPVAYCVGLALLGVGTVFVLSSFFALGFTGTFLGDYFGILKEARVTTFPFNLLDNPMYWGSTANYLGWAIMSCRLNGLQFLIDDHRTRTTIFQKRKQAERRMARDCAVRPGLSWAQSVAFRPNSHNYKMGMSAQGTLKAQNAMGGGGGDIGLGLMEDRKRRGQPQLETAARLQSMAARGSSLRRRN